jgi:hypothetical protein
MSDVDLFKDRKFPPFAFGQQADEKDAELRNYVDIGKLIVEWAKDPSKRPADMTAFRAAVGDNMLIHPKYTRLRIEQADDNDTDLEFVLRLPPKGQVTESEDRVKDAQPGQAYPLPNLYAVLPGLNSPLDAFYSRIADYTMRSCR